jgi:hypothetical protein
MVCDMPTVDAAGMDGDYSEDEWTARNWANAAYIAAAHPQAILDLISTNRDLQRQLDTFKNCENEAFPRCAEGACAASTPFFCQQYGCSPTQPKSGEVG